jgi:hypothetical protein
MCNLNPLIWFDVKAMLRRFRIASTPLVRAHPRRSELIVISGINDLALPRSKLWRMRKGM